MLADTIQIALAPVFLLVATASVMNVIAGRLARVVDRSRSLMQRLPELLDNERKRTVDELRGLDKRMSIINWSIGLCVASGLVVCVMVAMLFIQGGGSGALEGAIAASFIIAMALLLVALALFLAEVRLTIGAIHVPQEMLDDYAHGHAATIDPVATGAVSEDSGHPMVDSSASSHS